MKLTLAILAVVMLAGCGKVRAQGCDIPADGKPHPCSFARNQNASMAYADTQWPIVFMDNNKVILTIEQGGSVKFGEGFTADSAAKEFWKIVGATIPDRQGNLIAGGPCLGADGYGHPCPAVPFDVPPKEWDTTQIFYNYGVNIAPPLPETSDITTHHEECADKSRFLLQSEDGVWHCLALGDKP